MSQELSRIQRPSADRFQGKRKLLLAPLIYGIPAEATEGVEILQRYWEQMQSQVASLEASLGALRHIYHESLTVGGEEGLGQLGQADQRSHSFVSAKCQVGATLEATEDADFLLETLDLQRCLMVPMASESVARRLQEWLIESTRRRYERIADQIDDTLQADEVGLLLISERHQVQFPGDIEVFYIAPPALDDFHRWAQGWVAQQQRARVEAMRSEMDSGGEEPSGPSNP